MTPVSLAELRHERGRGIVVFVEGETEADDPFFYGSWFGIPPTTFTFLPCDGCRFAMATVARYKQEATEVPIFGIIDRDFADDEEVLAFNAQAAERHVLKLPRFSVENYLLEPDGWHKVWAVIWARSKKRPGDWDSPQAMGEQVKEAYRRCLPLAAYNWVVARTNRQYGTGEEYYDHPNALRDRDAGGLLSAFGQRIHAKEDLARSFRDRLSALENMKWPDWQKHVQGKPVLSVFHSNLPLPRGMGGPALTLCLNHYLREKPDAPSDIRDLLDQIRSLAGR